MSERLYSAELAAKRYTRTADPKPWILDRHAHDTRTHARVQWASFVLLFLPFFLNGSSIFRANSTRFSLFRQKLTQCAAPCVRTSRTPTPAPFYSLSTMTKKKKGTPAKSESKCNPARARKIQPASCKPPCTQYMYASSHVLLKLIILPQFYIK